MHLKCKSTSHRSLVTGQPGTSQPVTGQPITGQPVTSQPGTGQTGTGKPGTGQFFTCQPGTRQPVISHQSLVIQSPVIQWLPGTGHWTFNHQAPVTGHHVTGQWAPVSSPGTGHQMTDNDYPVANKTHKSSEQSFPNEPQNSSTSKRVLLPLEPDLVRYLTQTQSFG